MGYRNDDNQKGNKQLNIKAIALTSTAALVAVIVLWGSWYTVDQGERGVLLRNGAEVGTAEPGLGFKVPLIDKVIKVSTQTQTRSYDTVPAYSKDQQTAILDISVNYRLPADQVGKIYSEFGGEEGVVSRLLDQVVAQDAENVLGQYNAVTAIQDRTRLVADLQKAIQTSVKGPIIIESVQIKGIDFSDTYESSIEARMVAEVEVQKVKQVAEREKVQAGIVVIQAQAQADSVVAAAEAQAKATRLAGEAEADAIRAKSNALADNPNLIDLIQAENWDGKLPTTMVPGSTVPFLSITK